MHTTQTLNRMKLLNTLLQSEDPDDEVIDEYRRLQELTVEQFLPLVQALTEAGLFVVYHGDTLDRVESVNVNGGFQLNVET
jgi:hypothetical protein